ncbi:hypothetical protein Pmani_012095 [Petrolisthes manimaculis]|uniref:G-protein coupled receptors family 1 profile domain-containing protein n=1 Tax=Petrolisthes manimaculis TaxID=1843537 RepID=A0AAE1PZN8_9EUCA|nr:hypothetical protein Pmani_012095 [Petrolisthes manimaculis]
MPALITLAVITNLLNLAALIMAGKKGGKTGALAVTITTHRYLTWLSVTDLLAAGSLMPAIVYLDRSVLTYPWAFYYAYLDIPIMNALTSASVYIVVGMSVDR